MFLRPQTLYLGLSLCAVAGLGAAVPPPPPGGANAPPSSDPPRSFLPLMEWSVPSGAAGTPAGFAVRVPTGSWTRAGAAPLPGVLPGPVAALRGADGVWRGWGYLETTRPLLSFHGQIEGRRGRLEYDFGDGQTYRVSLALGDGVVWMGETSRLAPRNLFVFDVSYAWQPSAALAASPGATNVVSIYLPCHYDRREAAVGVARDPARADAPAAGIAVVSPTVRDALILWAVRPDAWRQADAMRVELWQRRQRAGDPLSRHFQGPETKSDSTPNPRTAFMLGQSLYEGHVTLEGNLGGGLRHTGWALATRPESRADLPGLMKRFMALTDGLSVEESQP